MKNKSRNVECFCGSKKKYKNCHAYLENLKVPTKGEIGAALARRISVNCMHHEGGAGCRKSIQAHSVPKSEGLAPLANKGHVLTFYEHNKFLNERIEPQPIGVNKASTFLGFCAEHDNDSFRHADQLSPDSSSALRENIYRALVHEKYKKVTGIEKAAEIAKLVVRGSNFDYQKMVHDSTSIQLAGLKAGCESLDKNIERIVRYISEDKVPPSFCIRVKGPPLCAMSACYSPGYDLKNRKIQSMVEDSKHLDYVSVIQFYKDGYNYTIIGSLSENEMIREYLRDIRDRILDNYFVSLAIAFNYCESVYFSYEFYESLGDKWKRYVVSLVENYLATMNRFDTPTENPIASLIGFPEVYIDKI